MQNETTDQKEARLTRRRNAEKAIKQNEKTEQREARLTTKRRRDADKARRQNETTEQREARLGKDKERELVEKILTLQSIRIKVMNQIQLELFYQMLQIAIWRVKILIHWNL